MADRREPRVDLEKEFGLTRRDLLRRGAIVGGTLLWAAPAVQTISRPAFALSEQGTARFFCCYCWDGAKPQGTRCSCAANGAPPLVPNNDHDCNAMCKSMGYAHHDFDSGAHACSCGTDPCTPCSCD